MGKSTILLMFYLICFTVMGQSGKTTVIPDDFPSFQVPGYEEEMESFRKLFFQQYETAGPAVPLWDEWLPMSTLWPAIREGHKNDDIGQSMGESTLLPFYEC